MGYDSPNYTQTPNLFLDEHLPEMGHAETKVVLAVIRQTFGWHKEEDRISISQFEEMTGLSRQGVINGIQDALSREVLERSPVDDGYEYSLVVNDVDQRGEGVVNEVDQGSQRSRPKVVNEVDPQKKGKKPSKESAPAKERDSEGVAIWVDVTGERPTIGTQQELKKYFETEAPRWDAEVFRSVLKEAFVNVDRDAHRIKLGYLESSYEKELEHDTNMAVTEDGKLKGSPEPGAQYNARGYRTN